LAAHAPRAANCRDVNVSRHVPALLRPSSLLGAGVFAVGPSASMC
jgi:hypothetical protein